MAEPVFFKKGESKQKKERIEFLSEPSIYSMADEWYDIADSDHFWMKWRFEVLKKIVPRGYVWGEILDIGCGNGIVGEQIERWYGCRPSGCDLNLGALRMVPPCHDHLYFYNIHQRHKDFEKAFLTILLMDVLEHIDDPRTFLDSVSFHLKLEGSLIINVPAIQLFNSRYDEVAGHVKRYSLLSLEKELNSAGFQLDKATYWGMSLIPLLLIRKLVLCFCRDSKIIKVGFRPMFLLADKILDFIRWCECRIFPRVPIGTSLMVIARKKA